MKRINLRLTAMLALTLASLTAFAQLRFNADGKFKIVQFTDIHWIYDDSRSDVAAENMRYILDAEKPDLVVYTGDLVFAKPAKPAYDKALEPVIERGLPFAVILGNHDIEYDLTGEEILQHLQSKPGNLTSTVEGVAGVTNYALTIKNRVGDHEAAVLYFFDTHSMSADKTISDGYAWVERDQIEWYRNESNRHTALNGGSQLPSLAFIHIPLPEYQEAAVNPNTFLVGTRKEAVCCPEINTGLFSQMLMQHDVMGVFAGHDHVNDYITEWKKIALAYGRYSGGSTVYHDIQGGNGARIIELTEGERSFSTWIRLRDGGKVVNEVSWPGDFKNK